MLVLKDVQEVKEEGFVALLGKNVANFMNKDLLFV